MRSNEKKKIKILVPNSVHTRPVKENSEKNSKKIQKIIKPLLGISFSQNGTRTTDKEKNNFSPEFHSYSIRARKFRKK